MKQLLLGFGVCVIALVGYGCDGSAAPTEAPPVTGKIPDWKAMTKEEKIALINKQPIPEQAKAEGIRRVEQGID